MRTLVNRHPAALPTSSLIEQFFGDPFLGDVGARLGVAPTAETVPLALDLSETDGHVIVRASLPGFRKEDVDISVHEGVLTISASTNQTSEEQHEKFYRRERRTGTFTRRVLLPETVQAEGVQAELREGVLTLRLAKTQKAQPCKISVS